VGVGRTGWVRQYVNSKWKPSPGTPSITPSKSLMIIEVAKPNQVEAGLVHLGAPKQICDGTRDPEVRMHAYDSSAA